MTSSVRLRPPAADEALHALRRGHPDARPLVFLHGITGSRRYFEGRVMHMSQRYRLIIPDLLGFGLSPKPQVDYTVPRFHMFYGFVAFITIGIAYSSKDSMRGRLEMFYGIIGLFLMGVGIRAVLQAQ